MENTQTVDNQVVTPSTESKEKGKESARKSKSKKSKVVFAVITLILVLLLLAVLYFMKGLFVAAIVNGSPISRLAVIQELEKQAGKQTLEAMIDEQLIESELAKQNISAAPEEVAEEIKKIKEQVVSQGQVFEDALAAQGMTEDELRKQIATQKKLEKVLADKITVSDEDVAAYRKENATSTHEGETEDAIKEEVRQQLKQQKFQTEAQKWVTEITARAKIKQYVTY